VRPLYPVRMVLAVSGPLFMGVVIGASVILLVVLLRREDRFDAEDRAREARDPLRRRPRR
jgi:hypothetical protein